jgi:hypothetical protein
VVKDTFYQDGAGYQSSQWFHLIWRKESKEKEERKKGRYEGIPRYSTMDK